jgi:hypothetical protein
MARQIEVGDLEPGICFRTLDVPVVQGLEDMVEIGLGRLATAQRPRGVVGVGLVPPPPQVRGHQDDAFPGIDDRLKDLGCLGIEKVRNILDKVSVKPEDHRQFPVIADGARIGQENPRWPDPSVPLGEEHGASHLIVLVLLENALAHGISFRPAAGRPDVAGQTDARGLAVASRLARVVNVSAGTSRTCRSLIENCLFAAPPAFDAARVRENCFSLTFIVATYYRMGISVSIRKFRSLEPG